MLMESCMRSLPVRLGDQITECLGPQDWDALGVSAKSSPMPEASVR